MKEIVEFRIFDDHYHLLPQPNNAKFNGIVYVIKVLRDDPLYQKIKELSILVEKNNDVFFGYFKISRTYTHKELTSARLLSVDIKSFFEPTGEECGTQYDESDVCKICGCNRKQVGPLILKKGSIPKKDIAETIGGEIVVSKHFAQAVKRWNLKGIRLEPVLYGKQISDYYQLFPSEELILSPHTIAGKDPFDTTTAKVMIVESQAFENKYDKEVQKCPKGHIIGLNLLSESYVFDSLLICQYDFFASQQKIGVKRGYLYPEPLYFCSLRFKKMVDEERLRGFNFEVAHVV